LSYLLNIIITYSN